MEDRNYYKAQTVLGLVEEERTIKGEDDESSEDSEKRSPDKVKRIEKCFKELVKYADTQCLTFFVRKSDAQRGFLKLLRG